MVVTRCSLLSSSLLLSASLLGLLWLSAGEATACTSIGVTPGASGGAGSLITYAADSHGLYGDLVRYPGGRHLPGERVEIFDGDSGKRLGTIPQVDQTYTVLGYLNEHGLAIGETTFGGRPELVDPNGGIDYVSLMRLALQRARTAREAITVMTTLVAEHGYASEGESFTLSDPTEVWLLEMVGRGPAQRGALWVARRVPDGMITAHANAPRIREFPRNDPRNTLFSPDVVTFAREQGWFSGKDAEFSFADTYYPLDFETLRVCDLRVWSVFRRAAPSTSLPPAEMFLGTAPYQPLPLWVKPDRPLGPREVMELMRDHFAGTPFDLSQGVGAGPYRLPYRWRPLTWKLDGVSYLNERAISTQQTGFSFVTQSRANLPREVGNLIWLGVDDSYSTVYLPFYAGIREVPAALGPDVASLTRFSWDSAFWVFNWVANMAYGRYSDMIVDIQRVQRELEADLLARQPEVEAAAAELYRRSPEQARSYLTRYSLSRTTATLARWRRLGEELLVKYLDGNVKDEFGKAQHPPYPEDWYRRIVAESGEILRVKEILRPGQPAAAAPASPAAPLAAPAAPPATPAAPLAAPAAPSAPPAAAPPAPHPDPALAGWYFKSRDQLGPLANVVPADFPFASEQLLLLPGTAQCGQLPRCCLAAREETPGQLVAHVPPEPAPTSTSLPPRCGAPGWLVRLPQAETRAVTPSYGEAAGGH